MYIIYKHYDIFDRLLYIGLTTSLHNRLTNHAQASLWIHRTKRIELEHCRSAEEMREGERELIERLHPLYNAQYNYNYRSFVYRYEPKDHAAHDFVEDARDDSTFPHYGRWEQYSDYFTFRTRNVAVHKTAKRLWREFAGTTP